MLASRPSLLLYTSELFGILQKNYQKLEVCVKMYLCRRIFPSKHGDMYSMTCHNVYCVTRKKSRLLITFEVQLKALVKKGR